MASIPTNNLEGCSNLATAATTSATTVSSGSSGSNNRNGNGNNKRKHSLLGGEASCQPRGNRRAHLIRKCTAFSSKRTPIKRGNKKAAASLRRSAAVATAVNHSSTGNTSDVDEHEVNHVNDGNNCSTSSSSSAQNNADAMIDDIAAMNEIGIANLCAGDALVAKESFISALSRCSLQKNAAAHHAAPVSNPLVPGCNSIMSSSFHRGDQKKMSATPPVATSSSSSSMGTHPPVSTATATTQNMQSSTASTSASKTTIGTTSTDATDVNKPSNLHVYQREEYDEGMHVYNEALYLDKETSTCKPLRDATLMYNVGQTHLRTRQYHDAKRWFSLALATFGDVSGGNECSSSSSTSTREENDDEEDDEEPCTNAAGSMLNEVMIHHNIAFCYYCLGDNDQAMSHYQTAFRRLQELGLGDLDIAACCNSIGILHLCRGSLTDSAKAMECLQLSLNIYKRVLGHESTQVATCLSNIARVFFSRQDFPTALALFQEALKIRQDKRKGIANKDSPVSASVSAVARINPVDEAAAMFNIGQTYQKLGKVDLALDHFKSFRELAEPILGKGHRDIATCIKAMACIHYESGKIETACELLEEAVDYSRRSGEDFPLELACLLRDMGCLYSMTNQTSKALASHIESLNIQRKLYDNDHKNPNIMVTLLHIAQNQKKLGNYTDALNVYRTVYAIQLDIFGPKSLEVAATLCSIGLMLYLKQDLQSSLNYYQEALRVRQEYYKTNNNFDIAATFNSIGLIAFKMNKLDLAKTAFQECIRIRFNLEGTDSHRDIVTLYSNLGTVFLANGEDKEAIQMFSESIRLERKTLGEKHLGVAVSLQHLAQLHQDRGELELAHEYFAEALKITRDVDESLMANKEKTICTLLNLMGNIHLMKAEVPQMMECFTEASRVCEQDFNSLVIAGYTFYGISKMHPPCAPEA